MVLIIKNTTKKFFRKNEYKYLIGSAKNTSYLKKNKKKFLEIN